MKPTLLLILLLTASGGAAGESSLSTAMPGPAAYNVSWDSPSQDHHGSMPLGNGDVALNAWMTPDGDLHLLISKTDAWDDNARLVKVGKVRVRMEPTLVAADRLFHQELNLATGAIEFTTRPRLGLDGADLDRTVSDSALRLWVDANRPVIQLTVECAEPVQATAYIELWRTNRFELAELQISDVMFDRSRPDQKHAPTVVEPDRLLLDQVDRIGWYHHNTKSVGPSLLAAVQGLSGYTQEDPLLHRTFGTVVTATGGRRLDDRRLVSPRAVSHRFSLFVLTEHPATPERWLTRITNLISQVESTEFATRRSAHERWWSEFWNRSWIRASANPAMPPTVLPVDGRRTDDPSRVTPGDEAAYVSQMYHLQRFITACAGRGAYPIKFNGSLFTVPPGPTEADPDYRRWGPGYWWQNTRLPYLSACSSGDFDLLQPLFRMYADELLPFCRYRTRLTFGHDGAFYPECIYFWGPIFSETYGWTPFEERADKLQESGWHKWEWVSGLELCWLMLDYYDHTLDRSFLADTALPFAHEILTFFNQHYPTNAQGKLVMHPSQALETWWHCTNAMPELAGCISITERLLVLPVDLTTVAERRLWQQLRDRLPDLPLRAIDGQPALAPAEFFAQKSNIENPELYAVFPFRLIAFNRPNPEWGIRALEHRWDRGNSGWRQDDLFMAALGLTPDARSYLVGRSQAHDPHERFPAFWGPNYDWTPDQDHGGVLMRTFQTMLLQTDGRQIYLFPAWPKDWDVEFKLHAPEQTLLEGAYRDGALQSLRVTPETRRADVTVLKPR